MKRKCFLVIASVVLMALVLVGCGGKSNTSTSSGSGSNSTTAAQAQQSANSTPSGELYDLADDSIQTLERDDNYNYSAVSTEKRTVMLAAIPSGLKKGIGTATTCNIQTPGMRGTYTVGFRFTVSSSADFKTLKDYYKTLGGTVAGENENELVIDFDWGKLFQCEYQDSLKAVQVAFSVN